MTITCADCGSTQTLPLLPRRGVAACYRCDRVLDRRRWSRIDVTFVCAAITFVLLPPAVFLPLMQSSIRGVLFTQSRLVSSVPEIYSEVWFPFAFGFFFLAFLFPAMRALFLIVVIGSIRWRWRITQRGRVFRWSEELRIWSMTDVVAIAGAIAYFRAAVPADVDILIGAWCYLALAVVALIGDRALDRRAVWGVIYPDSEVPAGADVLACGICEMTVASSGHREAPCPRCGATLNPDIAKRFAPTAAAVAATFPLCVPALSFAVIVNDRLTGLWEHTVLGTVELLVDYGYWELAVVVLAAGVMIPALAVLSLTWLLLRVVFPSRRGLVLRTRIYRILRRLVRWPMIIPFIAAIAAPIVNFPHVDDILAGPGATPYFGIVVLVMLAARLFEPQLMWRAAGETP